MVTRQPLQRPFAAELRQHQITDRTLLRLAIFCVVFLFGVALLALAAEAAPSVCNLQQLWAVGDLIKNARPGWSWAVITRCPREYCPSLGRRLNAFPEQRARVHHTCGGFE